MPTLPISNRQRFRSRRRLVGQSPAAVVAPGSVSEFQGALNGARARGGRLVPRCCISLAPLVDPAKGRGCTHRARAAASTSSAAAATSRARADAARRLRGVAGGAEPRLVRDDAAWREAQLSAVPKEPARRPGVVRGGGE